MQNPKKYVFISSMMFLIFSSLFNIFVNVAIVIHNSQNSISQAPSPLGKSFSVTKNTRHSSSIGADTLGSEDNKSHVIYGFLPYWKLDTEKFIQYDKLTDIAYFALHINPNGTFQKLDEEGNTEPGYNNWRNSKQLPIIIQKAKENNVRVALTLISHRDDYTDEFLTCRSCWNTLRDELIGELDYHKIKDVNLDFEYVQFADPKIADLYTEFSDYINKELDKTYGDSFVIVSTFADSNVKPRITKPYDLSLVTDGIFIMAYDFHRPTSDTAGAVSPITGAGNYHNYDILTMLDDYLANIPPNKIIMGVPYYGYNWVVESATPYATRIPGDDAVGFSMSQTYEYVMDTILRVNPVVMWDDVGKAPYFSYVSPTTGSTRQAYFDNAESLKIKYELIKQKDLAGVGIWALGYDGGYQELWNLLGQEFPLFK